MKTKLRNLLLAVTAFCGICMSLTCCNSSDDTIYLLPSSATMRSFSLSSDDKVLNNLDSVFFSIDLYNRQVFNADSLPFGTVITGLVPVITYESASVVEIIEKHDDGEDRIINYLENTTDTVDFTHPVTVRIVSYDGVNEANYTVRVNVHTVPTDTMVWSRIERGSLPTVFSAVNTQHTTMSPDGVYYCMTSYQGEYCIANTTSPGGEWAAAKSAMSFTPDINTFTASTDGLYIISTDGLLYKSADNGLTWTSTQTSAKWIIGAYGSRLMTTTNENGNWQIKEYPGGSTWNAPSQFPVTNTSNATTLSFEMSISEQMLTIGGRQADGALTSDVWGFDGKDWAKISRTSLPEKLENVALVPYFEVHQDTISWRVRKPATVLLAMTGNNNAGVANDTVYMSVNFGLTWTKAPEGMQIPRSVVPSRTHAQAFPFVGKSSQASKAPRNYSTAQSVFTASWESVLDRRNSASRATGPITEWDIPYIYLFGGVNSQGATYNTIYRGVITALTFKPLQ